MKLCVLYSGGKDSTLALLKASRKSDIDCLISMVSKNKESYMFHTPAIEVTKLQAEAMGLPIIMKYTDGKKEDELADLEEAIKEERNRFGSEGVVTGAVASVYQASRVQRICDRLGMVVVNPLWLMPQEEVLKEGLREGLDIIVSGIFAEQLGSEWLGRRIDGTAIKELERLSEKFGISPSGEGGELETTVLDAPFFRKRIVIEESEVSVGRDSGVIIIKKAGLVGK